MSQLKPILPFLSGNYAKKSGGAISADRAMAQLQP